MTTKLLTEKRLPQSKPITGPGAIGCSFKRFFTVTTTLAFTDFKLKFYGSILGYLWQLMRPLMLFGVLYVVFTQFVRVGGKVHFYPVVLLTGIVLFTFFSEATTGAVSCLVDRESLLRKVRFPRLAIPLAVVCTGFLNLLLNLIAVFVFMLASGVSVKLSWLELPLLLVVLALFSTGIAMLLSSLYVRYRDIKPIWDVLGQMLFYGSPVLYPIEVIPSTSIQQLLMMNPFAATIQQIRHSVIDNSAPTAAQAAGGIEFLLIPTAILIGLVVIGYCVFRREAPLIAEEL